MSKRKNRRSSLQTMYQNGGGICHYCKDPVFLAPSGEGPMSSHPKRATRDHVVPRYYGGVSHPNNYVLACAECNSGRNHELSVCDCSRCVSIIEAALRRVEVVDKLFKDLVKFNKPRIRRYRGVWHIYIYGKTMMFNSWAEAMYEVQELAKKELHA